MGTNTGLGIGIGIPFKNFSSGGRQPLPPDLKASLKGVWIAYGKSNNDADRSIVKNLVDPDNPFIISNAAYKLNSGYGLYGMDFLDWKSNSGMNFTSTKLTSTKPNLSGGWLTFRNVSGLIPETKVKVSGAPREFVFIANNNGADDKFSVTINNGVYTIPEFTLSSASGFYINNNSGDWSNLVIEQIPSFEGAFVTDGINDLITSTKTVQEMGITDEITVVSMIHKISSDNNWSNLIGELKGDHTFVANRGINTDKTGIYGYTYNYNENAIVINNILGDKNDYIVRTSTSLGLDNKYYVTGFTSAGIIQNISQIAWYWTFIANRVLTTDEINQVIAYYNLDRTLNPDILCNTIKQGITNENHAEFGDKLIDFSGNGRDIQLNNIAWKGDSGIGKYETDFTKWLLDQVVDITKKYSSFNIKTKNDSRVNSWVVRTQDTVTPAMKVKITGITPTIESFIYRYSKAGDKDNYIDFTSDGIYELPKTDGISWEGFRIIGNNFNVTVEQIPSHAGALCLDGVDDFGKVTGMPIYKDYTIVVDYERISGIEQAWAEALISKSYIANQGAFVLMETNGMAKHSCSFGTYTTFNKDDSTRTLLYQSKYKCGDVDLNAGTGIDRDTLWLGTYRDNYNSFFNRAIYSLMSFPYSMSEFLIERQLKKHKLGTLYPNMVEFRPVIKHDDRITAIKYYHIKGSSWINLKPGDYIPVGSKISITTNLKSPYTIANVVSSSLTDIKVVPSAGGGNAYDILGYVTDKSPQKINLTIEQDEKYVLFNPIIKSNVEYHKLDFYLNNFEKRINIGDYIPKDAYLRANFYLKNNVDELTVFTFNGVNIDYRRSIVDDTAFNIGHIYNYDSPQEVNITIDEYIRYEDIKQPYPLLFEFTDENGNLISWGGKAKVGNTITRTKSVSNANILAGLYNTNNYKLNGKPLEGNSYVVEKQMVFTCTATWDFDNNEPKCILSPRLLRIPNSSYKILGHIPDISGHGNHGKINNSAYAEGSGVNEDGSYQLDGVDDFITIPTLSSGGKQVLMKVNWNTIDSIIYDQRGSGGFAIYCSDYHTEGDSITVPAYKGRNAAGTTYIDGIRNEYVIASQLKNVTHNIVEILDTSYAAGNINPIIGKSNVITRYGSLALYDFMLFDNISTDDKIKELNEYVGIEAKVELPPYYWDAYGKTNLDGDKATIQQRGVAVGDYDLTNNNLAYEGMSGYNGYPVVFGENKTWVNLGEYYVWTVSATKFNITQLCFTKALQFSYIKANGSIITANNKDIAPFRIKVTGIEPYKFSLRYIYLSTANATLESTITINSDGIYELPKSFASDGSLTSSDRWVGFSFIKRNTELADVIDGVNVTIEVLPEYENGLVYDGITDYSKNANIPALDDFTAIIKREWLKKQGCPLIKGSKVYEGGNGNALLLEWDKAYNFVFYKRTDIMEGELPDNISFITPTNYNGNVITRGSEQDTNGICIAGDGNAGFANMVFYKLILYPKTIPLLQINFLKNLMERDEIIDLTNPIFIKNE